MIGALFNQPNYQAARKLLDATMLRHEAIASNLANVETPHYKRVDVAPSFQAQLSQAVAAQDSGLIGAVQPQIVEDPTAVPRSRDGNSVHLEHELTALTQNFVAHTLETQLVTGSLNRLRLAITGRGG
jgi:flagellar basal-body rod protein FlgB